MRSLFLVFLTLGATVDLCQLFHYFCFSLTKLSSLNLKLSLTFSSNLSTTTRPSTLATLNLDFLNVYSHHVSSKDVS